VATLQINAIAVRLRARPKRSAISDTGTVRMPTISATMLLSDPSCVSVRLHSSFSSGKTALSTWRDM